MTIWAPSENHTTALCRASHAKADAKLIGKCSFYDAMRYDGDIVWLVARLLSFPLLCISIPTNESPEKTLKKKNSAD